MKITNRFKLSILAAILSASSTLQATTVIGNLGGLLTPTGSATNANMDRQYSWTTSGGEVTITYTLGTSDGDLSNAFTGDSLFRYAPNTNVGSEQSFMITINTIAANAGWTLNTVAMANNVTVAINGGNTVHFSVNGGATFDYVGTGTGVSQQVVNDSRFANFDSPGDTLSFLNVNQTANSGMNLRNLTMTFDVTAVPEPSAALLGGLGLLALLRRRR